MKNTVQIYRLSGYLYHHPPEIIISLTMFNKKHAVKHSYLKYSYHYS